ncbi:hypothetical protein FHG87_009531 [Trinorchestia longiramus]|nr:hypothetical protein FHG87_009531 [Trinorchestia longiramus]
MDWREEIIEAVINSCKDLYEEKDRRLNAVKSNYSAYVKVVNREQKERGDLSVSLQPFLRDVTSCAADFAHFFSLLTENPVALERVLKGIESRLESGRYPVESSVLKNGVILLWLCKPIVLRHTILQAVAVTNLSSFSATENNQIGDVASVHIPVTDHASLYGANNIFSNQIVSVYSTCPRLSDSNPSVEKVEKEHSRQDISDFRAGVVADHISALILLCGGRLNRQYYSDTLPQDARKEKDASCSPLAEGEQEEVTSWRLGVVPCSGHISSPVGPLLVVGPVVDAQHKKKLRDWDALRCSSFILSELEAASAHKQSIDGIGWHDLLSQQSLSCLRMILLATSPSSPLPLNATTPSNVRDVAFQLYNYSRLSTLLATYSDLQRRKVVPPLPSPELINFELLKEPEEWELAWVCVHTWPSLMQSLGDQLKSCAESVCFPDNGSPKTEGIVRAEGSYSAPLSAPCGVRVGASPASDVHASLR